MNHNKMNIKGVIVIISSPSGTGKTTVVQELLKKNIFNLSISYTTRPKRLGEHDGKDYIFVDDQTFCSMQKNNEFAETAKIFNYYYGTTKKSLHKINQGDIILLDVNWEGSRSISAEFPKDVLRIFLLPPTMQELQNRLIKRKRDPMSVIHQRMERVREEISHYNEYDYVLINDDIKKVVQDIANIIHVERYRLYKNHDMQEFAKRLMQISLESNE